jgi:hypothetical protein
MLTPEEQVVSPMTLLALSSEPFVLALLVLVHRYEC